MGIYVNPGNTAFREAVNSQIYVDKSGLISYTNSFLSTKQKNICVSRQKSFRSHLNRHNVIRLDIQRFLETEDD